VFALVARLASRAAYTFAIAEQPMHDYGQIVVRRIALPLLALAVFLPSIAFARTQFVCDVDLVVRDSCCCPPKKAKPPADLPAMTRACCKIEKRAPVTAPIASAASTHSPWILVTTALETTTVMPPIPEPTSAIVARAQAPPPERSLFSQRCSLLV
jgi:hypothetical protein